MERTVLLFCFKIYLVVDLKITLLDQNNYVNNYVKRWWQCCKNIL